MLHQDELSAYMVDFNGPVMPDEQLALAGSARFMERRIAELSRSGETRLRTLLEGIAGCPIE